MSRKANFGSPVRMPCDAFQSMDATLHPSMAPDAPEPGTHGDFSLAQALQEGTSLLHTRVLHRYGPGLELVASGLAEQAADVLSVVIGVGHHRVKAEEMGEEGWSAGAQVFRVRQTQVGRSRCLESWWRRRRVWVVDLWSHPTYKGSVRAPEAHGDLLSGIAA